MYRRPEAAPSKTPKPRWLRAALWIGGLYAALNVFALVTMLAQEGSWKGLFALVTLAGGGWIAYRTFFRPAEKPYVSDNHGTAQFEGMQITPPHAEWLREGIFLGKSSNPDANDVPVDRQPGIPMCTTPEHHTLIVARTRTGKGTRVIIGRSKNERGMVGHRDGSDRGSWAVMRAFQKWAFPDFPGISRNFPEIPLETKGTETNRREQNQGGRCRPPGGTMVAEELIQKALDEKRGEPGAVTVDPRN